MSSTCADSRGMLGNHQTVQVLQAGTDKSYKHPWRDQVKQVALQPEAGELVHAGWSAGSEQPVSPVSFYLRYQRTPQDR